MRQPCLLMAAVPPVVAGGAPPAPPKTHHDKWVTQGDHLGGEHAILFRRCDTTVAAPKPATAPLEHTIDSSDVAPKAFLVPVRQGTGHRIACIHRPSVFIRDPVETSPWDGRVFCFQGDVLPGNFIAILELPNTPFETVGPQVAPAVANMAALEGTLVDEEDSMPPQTDGAPDTDTIYVRRLVQAPHACLHLVLNRDLTPLQAWRELTGAIQNDGRAGDLSPLIDWLRAALTTDTAANPDPFQCMGDRATALPPLTVDARLQEHHWRALLQDLPALDATAADNTDRVLAFTNMVRANAARVEATRSAAGAAAAAPKTPTEAFPQIAPAWPLLSSVLDDAALPTLCHAWANSTKAEWRLCFACALEARAQEPDAASRTAPVVSKELCEMVLQGKVAPHMHQVNDLTAGVSPFTCGFFLAGQGSTAQVRAERYDLALAGDLTPAVAEQEEFRTKDTPLPTSTCHCGSMLQATSLALDVIQGSNHPHAVAFRQFCLEDWRDMVDLLEQSGALLAEGNALPRICREVQMLMGVHLRRLTQGGVPRVPDYTAVAHKVLHGQFSLLAQLPRHLLGQPEQTTNSQASSTSASNSGTPSAVAAAAGRRDPGAAVANPNPVRSWLTAFAQAGICLATVRRFAPRTMDSSGTACEVCLSHHPKGMCFANCERSNTHRNLSPRERTAMSAFVRDHVSNPQEGGAPAPAPAPAPAAST